MPKVFYDERDWTIKIEMKRDDCPFLYYPNVTYGCEHPKRIEQDPECILEKCPLLHIVTNSKAENNSEPEWTKQ